MNWDDLRLLLAVSRRGSFLQAGETLGMTVRGALLVETAQQLESELARRTATTGLSGTVLVSAGEGFMQPVQEAIARFTQQHPGCSVDFHVTPDLLKVARHAVDVAIRTVHLGEPSLVYQRISTAAFSIFAAPAYAESLGIHPQPGDAGMIDLLPPLDQLPHLRAARAAGFSRVRFRVSSFSAQLHAVEQGHGAAVLPRALATGLAEPFGPIALPPLEVFLVTRPQALRQPHIRAFVTLLQEQAQLFPQTD